MLTPNKLIFAAIVIVLFGYVVYIDSQNKTVIPIPDNPITTEPSAVQQ